ncbi:unnamed protein product, partial [Polarella glacialis]
AFNNMYPILSTMSKSTTQWLLGKLVLRGWFNMERYWSPLFKEAERLKAVSDIDGYQLLVTGHSLGGVFAAITGAHIDRPVIAFSPPGEMYTIERLQTDERTLQSELVTIQPHEDVVPMVDRQVGFTQFIECHSSNPAKCHSILRTTGELFAMCEDPRRRNATELLLELGYNATATKLLRELGYTGTTEQGPANATELLQELGYSATTELGYNATT